MSSSFTVYFNGQQFGPHTQEDLAAMLANGTIDDSASVHSQGWPDWRPVSSVIRPAASAPPMRAAFAAGGLDELASLAQEHTVAPAAAQAHRPARSRRGAKPKSRRNLYIGLAAGGGGVLALLIIILCVAFGGAGMTLQRQSSHDIFFYWTIGNDGHSALTIDRVVFNGEHVARLVNLGGEVPRQTESTDRVTLGSGDSQAYFERSEQGAGKEYYLKKVTFIDLYTSRGDFRYYVATGFSSERPEFDSAKAQASDEEMAAESLKLEQGRHGTKMFD